MSFDQILQVKQKIKAPVVVIGHTGFKGTWLTLLLEKLGIETIGISLPADKNGLYSMINKKSTTREFIQDIRDFSKIEEIFNNLRPRFVIHLAAQPLVLNSYKIPRETFETNVLGTANVLDALSRIECCEKIIVSTTDKVYKNNDHGEKFNEDSPLGGKDPYSWSKVGTEAAIGAWQQISQISNGPKIISVRAGNVIGGGDNAINRLLPDIVKSLDAGNPIQIRNPHSTRPWQHALDPLWGYLLALVSDADEFAFNFSPDGRSLTVEEVTNIASQTWGTNTMVNFHESNNALESKSLELDSTLAKRKLNWQNQWDQAGAVISTIEWWKLFLSKDASAFEACDINLGELLENKKN
jgi:CDP-glucose 4,6-dehydratase